MILGLEGSSLNICLGAVDGSPHFLSGRNLVDQLFAMKGPAGPPAGDFLLKDSLEDFELG